MAARARRVRESIMDHTRSDVGHVYRSGNLTHNGGSDTVGTNERVLSTVFFTDIVSSTELLSAHGDAHWSHELDVGGHRLAAGRDLDLAGHRKCCAISANPTRGCAKTSVLTRPSVR